MPESVAAIKKLRERRLEVFNRMEELRKQADAAEGELSGDVLTSWETANTELDELTRQVQVRERSIEIERIMQRPQGEPGDPPTPGDPHGEPDPEARAARAFNDYIRHGLSDTQTLTGFGAMRRENRAALMGLATELPETELRDIGVGSGAAGGFLVPQGFLEKMTEVQKYFGPMRKLANTMQTTSGNDMPWPNNDDTGNVGAILGENTVIPAQDVALTSRTLKAWMYTSLLVKASWQLLNDSAFDVESFLSRKLGQRIGRIQNTHFTTGTGTGQPEGITTNAIANSPKITLANGNTTSFSTSTIGYNGLVDTLHALNYAYRQGGNLAWQVADLTLAAIRKLADTQGRPIWVPAGSFSGVAIGDPDSLLGYPVYVNSDLATMAANAVVAAVGDWREYYIIRDVMGIQMIRLDERYADQLQAGFFAFARTDGRVDDVKAAAFLQMSAT